MPNEIPTRFPRSEPEPATFGGAVPASGHRFRRQPDPGMRRLAIIAGGIGGALLLIVGAWSLTGRHSSGVPVVEAPGGPLRVKPENRGGMQVTGADDLILSGDSGKQPEALAPPPESPEPNALQAPRAAPPPRPPAAAHATATTTLPSAAPAPASPRPLTAETAPSGKASPATPDRPPLAHLMAARAVLPGKPVAASEPAPRTPGRMEVQLAALSSEQAAKTEWDRLERRMPELLGGHRPLVVRAERDGHILWRLRTGGFGDAGQANAFCEHVRAKGGGCAIASF